MKIARSKSVEAAYQALKKMIATKVLRGGDRVVKEMLCQTMDVDLKTLGKALVWLELEDLVIDVPHEGLVVRNFSSLDIAEIFDCRIALETIAVRQFALYAPQDRIDDLRNLLVPFERGPLSAKVYQKINFHFHDIILANCGNTFVHGLFAQGNIWLFMEVIGLIRPLKEILQEHLDMVSAIHQRDAQRAALLMRKHLENSKHAFLT